MGGVVRRFLAKVLLDDDDRCWEWTASRDSRGYGRIGITGKNKHAHRVAYELFRGSIPNGLTIDHLCRVRHCVNPWHLEPVTNLENIRRGVGVSVRNAAKTHCPSGHPYDEANTILIREGTGRRCRTCASDYHRARRNDDVRRQHREWYAQRVASRKAV